MLPWAWAWEAAVLQSPVPASRSLQYPLLSISLQDTNERIHHDVNIRDGDAFIDVVLDALEDLRADRSVLELLDDHVPDLQSRLLTLVIRVRLQILHHGCDQYI